MVGKMKVFLLALTLSAVSPLWAQDSASSRPDELQIIEFDYDNQNKPPAVNLPTTSQAPPDAPAPAAKPALIPAPAAKPALIPAPAAKPALIPAPAAKGVPPTATPNQEKVITIIGEPEAPPAAARPAVSAPSDEELLDSLFNPAGQPSGGAVPSKKNLAPASAKPAGQAEKPRPAGPKTPAVSPLRPPVPAAPSSVKVERSSEPSSAKVEKSPAGMPKVMVSTIPGPDGQAVRLFHDGAAIIEGFNPRRRAVVDPRTRPKPPAAASYPVGRGLDRGDFRHWELGTYYWSLVAAGYQARSLGFAAGRSMPINQAVIPAGYQQPKNFW